MNPNSVRPLLNEIFYLASRSPILVHQKVQKFIENYQNSDQKSKLKMLENIAKEFHPEEKDFRSKFEKTSPKENFIQFCRRVQTLTEPKYFELFRLISRQANGVRSLVHLRADLLDFLPQTESADHVKRMDDVLQELLATWFSTGLLQVERITWQSPCEIVQRISEYEAVHPIRTWIDLKRRLGPYRRCFVYTHHMMPNDPLVILHVALMDDISSSIQKILKRMASNKTSTEHTIDEDPNLMNSAIFYSISSTQPGLRGIELGNALIKRVVRQLQIEHPQLNKFSSLSPIPGFGQWLSEELNATSTETISSNLRSTLKSIFADSSWHLNESHLEKVRPILMNLCAHYLTRVKNARTGYARDPVANFHLRNGAVLWRLNWLADRSERGWKQSLSMMVNYRYYDIEQIERNSIDYIDKRTIQIDEQVQTWISSRLEI